MAARKVDGVSARISLFSRTLPNTFTLFILLIFTCLIAGIASEAILLYGSGHGDLGQTLASGVLTGLLALLMPTLLTIVTFKFLKGIMKVRHIIFVSFIGMMVYALFFVLASAILVLIHNVSIANAVALVGDAMLFGWWLFVNKILLGQKTGAVFHSLVQPAINLLLYYVSSNVVFTFYIPFGLLILKLGAGIAIFALISYTILYIFDRPMKKGLGLQGIEMFSEALQNWMFDVDLSLYSPFDNRKFGTSITLETHTLVFKRKKDRSIKCIMFAPELHYGPLGTMGGSNFPYLLERHAESKYKAGMTVAHCAINEDRNPVSASQFNSIRDALDRGVRLAKKITVQGKRLDYYISSKNSATIQKTSIGDFSLITLTRAPRVTEDINDDAAEILRRLFKDKSFVMLDAHNSRYEGAPQKELHWLTADSPYMRDYMDAIASLGKPSHSTSRFRVGFSSVDAYWELNGPKDMAPGNISCTVFAFNGFKHAMIYVNSNNVLPQIRNMVVEVAKKRFGISAELYTTDTHYVNALQRGASNVLGRYTKSSSFIAIAEKAMKEALSNIEEVDVYYRKEDVENFRIWGTNVRERMITMLDSAVKTARILVPVLMVGGFILATLIVSVL